MGPLRTPVGVPLIERARRDAGHQSALQEPREGVRHVELPGVSGVGKDHVGAEDRDRQAAQVVRLPQQHLARPLAVRVAVRIELSTGRTGLTSRMSPSSTKSLAATDIATATVDRYVTGLICAVIASRMTSAVPTTLGPNSSL